MPKQALQALAELYSKQQYQALISQAEVLAQQFPQNYLIPNLMGASYAAMGQIDKAIASYHLAIKMNPSFVDAYCNLGAALDGSGLHQQALETYQQALKLNPKHAVAHNNMATALSNLGNHEQAVISYQEAIALKPNYADAFANLGRVLLAQGQFLAAANAYNTALKLAPNNVQWHFNRAKILERLGRPNDAITAYKNTLKLNPNYAEAYYNLALIVKLQGNNQAALQFLAKALALKPDYILAHYSMGNVLNSLGQQHQAIASYQKAVSLAPDYDAAQSKKYYLQAHSCDWQAMADDNAAAQVKLAQLGLRGLVSPFDMLALDDSAERHFQRSTIFAQRAYSQTELPSIKPAKEPKPRIRIGYFSADFHNHATMFLMARLFELHDRDKFEIFVYSFGLNKGDAMRDRLKAAVKVFHDVSALSDKDIALLARKDSIDIAVDLKGYTEGARMGVFAHRAAAIQVSYLGYPGPIAAPFIDYVLADNTVIPSSHQRYYSEQVAYLPHSYQVNDNGREIAAHTPSRKALGLPDKGFVFSCFNNNYKISAAEFDVWMRLLKQVKGSVLWLFKGNDRAEKNLRKEAKLRGINPNRLVFAERKPQAEHLARQRQADLFLDTFSCNAHTTASDALWVGLPVITKIGNSFAARVAASLLEAIELPELITTSVENYEALALELAQSPECMQSLKAKLAANIGTTALFDTPQSTRDIEQAYQTMMALYRSGKAPQTISVKLLKN